MVAIRSSKTHIAKTLRNIDLNGIRVRLIDAKDQVVGHLAARLALILQGKDKPTYQPSEDKGDVCVVINTSQVTLTGRKWDEKLYRWHTGYPGGLRERTAKVVFSKRPEDILWRAVSGMLPKNRTRRARMRKLLLFKDESHNLQDVELVKWEMPEKRTARKIGFRQARQAPPVKR